MNAAPGWRSKIRHRPVQRAVGICLTLVGVVAICVITLTPATVSEERLPLWCMACGERPAVDVLLNVLLFIPVSVGLGLCGMKVRRALFYGVLGSVLIESLQFAVVAGRFPSVRDVLSNAVGVLLGYSAGRRWVTLIHPEARPARSLALVAAALWLATQTFTAWAMGVAAPPTPWWAQLEPDYDGYPAVFAGKIVGLSIGSVAIVESDLVPQADEVRRQLLAGAPLQVLLTQVQPTRGLAMILVISAGPVHDVAYWEQDGRAAVFTVPVRGTFVGLRTPSVRIADAMPLALQDTVRLTGAYAHGRYRLTAERGGAVVQRDFTASPSLTWAFLLPLPAYAFGAEVRLCTALWLAAAWLLSGYWSLRASAALGARPMLAAMVITLTLGLALAPWLFDLPVAHWSEWLAAAVGFGAGWLIARRALRNAHVNLVGR